MQSHRNGCSGGNRGDGKCQRRHLSNRRENITGTCDATSPRAELNCFPVEMPSSRGSWAPPCLSSSRTQRAKHDERCDIQGECVYITLAHRPHCAAPRHHFENLKCCQAFVTTSKWMHPPFQCTHLLCRHPTFPAASELVFDRTRCNR